MQRQSRTTKQRMVILETLRSVRSHPTADEIYTMTRVRLPRISLGTVYRNLDLLVRQGEILCLESAGTQRRFDGAMHAHQHVRCLRCGKIADVFPALKVPSVQELSVDGFTLSSVRLEFEGVCAACAGAEKEA